MRLWHRRANQDAERYFAFAPEMVVLAGFDGYWKRVNPTVEVVLGYTAAEALSRPFIDFVHPEDRDRVEEEARRVIGGSTAFSFVTRMVCKDGSSKWIEWTATPVPKEQVMWGVGRDVTERRRSEGEEAALRRLATLVAEGRPPSEIFSAVSEEVGRLFGSEQTVVSQFDPGGPATIVMGVAKSVDGMPVGSRWELEDGLAAARVYRTGRSARIDAVDWSELNKPIGAVARRVGVVSTVSSPIHVDNRLWGTISVPAKEPLPPDAEERLEKFTQVVATAIANAQSGDALARLASEQAALRRVATLVARDAPSNEVFESVATEVGQLFDTDITIVGRYDDDGMATAIGNWSASPGGVPVGTRSEIGGRNVLTMVAETGKPARIDGYDDASGEAAEIARRHGWSSSIAAPISVEGRLWGVMLVATQRPEPFPAGAEERLATFTDLIATAVGNAQAHDELRRFADEQAALGRVATLVAAGAAPEEVFTAVTDEISSLVGLEQIELVRYDADARGTVIAASGDHPFPAGSSWSLDDPSVMATVARTRRAARIDDYSTLGGEIARTARRAGFQSAIGAPITVEGRLWGVVIAISTDPQPIPEQSEARLGHFTELVATAVANAEARDALERVAAEQGALRRVATLVAASTAPSDVFAAVTNEIALVLGADATLLCRADPDGAVVVVGAWAADASAPALGTRVPLGGTNLTTIVLETGRQARIESYGEATGEASEVARSHGLRSAVGAPIVVEGRLWGLVIAGTTREVPLPPNAEERLAGFSELVATAIANAQAQGDLTSLAEQQAALRRVATLVARRAAPEVVFRAVADEAGGLLGAEFSALVRIESDDTVTVMAGPSGPYPLGERVTIAPGFLVEAIRETGRAARFETDDPAAEWLPESVRSIGVRSAVATPIVVEGALWGAVVLGSFGESFPPETEQRLDEFTELVATGISNATGRAELLASRARVVAAGDEARRRIERNLHDGTQQRLVALGMAVRAAEASLPEDRDDLVAELSSVADGLAAALEDLQEISRGIHPGILSKGGLAPALRALAHRSTIPVDLDITADVRLAEPIEVAAYFIASEALANASKYSDASRVDLSLAQRDGRLVLSVRDDGVGGADPSRGSGLVGLTDRVEALGGSISVDSRVGDGTRITAELPVEAEPAQADR